MGTDEFLHKQKWPLGYPAAPGSLGMIAGLYPKEFCRSCANLVPLVVDGKKKAACQINVNQNSGNRIAYINAASPACKFWKAKPKKKAAKKIQAVGDMEYEDEPEVQEAKHNDQGELF